jgi:hypothetical protein
MAWSVQADRKRRISYVQLSGLVTYRTIKEAQRVLATKVHFDPAFPLLIDLRGVDELQLSATDIYAIVTVSPVAASTRRAILVDTLPVFGTARLYAMVREDLTAADMVRVCHTVAAAAEWLGVDALDVLR